MFTVEGRYCHISSTYCSAAGSEPCLNGGTCRNEEDKHVCDCAPGFTGQFFVFIVYTEVYCSWCSSENAQYRLTVAVLQVIFILCICGARISERGKFNF